MAKDKKLEPDKHEDLIHYEPELEPLMQWSPTSDEDHVFFSASANEVIVYEHDFDVDEQFEVEEGDEEDEEEGPPTRTVYLQRNRHVQKSTKADHDKLFAAKDLSTFADDSFIDTQELAKKVGVELKSQAIPQTLFAERVIGRSQGTLSDLLRNPKPWAELKAGRDTYRKMFQWLRLPLQKRLAAVGFTPSGPNEPSKPTSNSRKRASSESSQPKKPRFTFTVIQKRTLHAIFKETQRPSKEMQHTIARHLGLDQSTVANFFMNARRRVKYQPEWAAKLADLVSV